MLNQQAMARLKEAQLRPEALVTIFENLDKLAEAEVATELTVGYQHPDDRVAEGELVPVIILALRPVNVRPTDSTT